MKTLIKNVAILTMESGKKVVENTNLVIKDDRIFYIGDIHESENFDRVISGENKLLMPGIVNAHTHIPMSLLRNYANDLPLFEWLSQKIWPVEDKFTSEHIYWGSMLSMAEMIKGGTTCFADMYFFMEDMARAVEETGMRASLSRGMMGDDYSEDVRFDELRSLYKNYNGAADGRITVMAGPHAPYTCSENYLNGVMNISSELDIPIHIHLSESRGEVEDSHKKHGMSPIEQMEKIGLFKFKTLAAHCVHLSDNDIDILAKNNVSVVYNPGSNLKLGNGFAPVKKMIDRGVNVALGTDGASSNNNLNMFEEMNLASIVNKAVCEDTTVIPAIKSIEMGTINGINALNLNGDIGEIKVGNKADLILVDFNKAHLYPKLDYISSIVYSSQASDVSDVIINGKIVMENYELKTIDLEKVIYNVEKLTKELF